MGISSSSSLGKRPLPQPPPRSGEGEPEPLPQPSPRSGEREKEAAGACWESGCVFSGSPSPFRGGGWGRVAFPRSESTHPGFVFRCLEPRCVVEGVMMCKVWVPAWLIVAGCFLADGPAKGKAPPRPGRAATWVSFVGVAPLPVNGVVGVRRGDTLGVAAGVGTKAGSLPPGQWLEFHVERTPGKFVKVASAKTGVLGYATLKWNVGPKFPGGGHKWFVRFPGSRNHAPNQTIAGVLLRTQLIRRSLRRRRVPKIGASGWSTLAGDGERKSNGGGQSAAQMAQLLPSLVLQASPSLAARWGGARRVKNRLQEKSSPE